ncbi:MAG TPA: hypothetical protein VFZ11_03390 [Gemmatimonadaceae bacterium]
MNSIICDAIRAKRRLRFVYDGYERIVEPHVYGINTANHEALRGWLVAGWSESEAAPGWRTYLEREMRDVHALAQAFDGPRDGYVADDRQMRQVHCRLEAASAAARPERPVRERGTTKGDAPQGDVAPRASRP